MRKKWILIIGIILIVLAISGFFFKSRFDSAQAGILIQTNPQSIVYIDGVQMGTTPYQAYRKAEKLDLRLVPESPDIPLSPYETKLTLVEGIETVVKRDFGPTEDESSGEILSYEKISGKSGTMAVVSVPDVSQVSIDGELRGFTPFPVDAITSGEHQILVNQAGYLQREIGLTVHSGYKLTVIAKLAKDMQKIADEAEEASKSGEAIEEEKIEDKVTKLLIKETPVGFLRVRKSASTGSAEIGRVNAGVEFNMIEETEKSDWYKIEYEKGKEGWVSAEYVQKNSD